MYLNLDVELEDVLHGMTREECEELVSKLEVDAIKERMEYIVTPRQVLYALRETKVDLKGLRDIFLEHYPLTSAEKSVTNCSE